MELIQRTILSSTPGLIAWTKTLDGVVLSVNSQYSAELGFDPSGRNFRDSLSPALVALAEDLDRRTLADGSAEEAQQIGSDLWWAVQYVARDERGTVICGFAKRLCAMKPGALLMAAA